MIHEEKGKVVVKQSVNISEDIASLVEEMNIAGRLAASEKILVKPNIVDAIPPPVTTPVDIVASLVDYLVKVTDAEIIVGDGTGSVEYDTFHVFAELGYMDMAMSRDIHLTDLNLEPGIRISNHHCRRWPEMFLPKIAFESFIISIPVLKAHTLAKVTLTMKNMMGLLPPEHYRNGGAWNKSSFHAEIHESIADLNRYRTPDLTILDARRGMATAHLYGPECDPPPGIVAASYDPVAIDAYGASLLGYGWSDIDYIKMLNGEIGQASPLNLVKIG